MSLMNWTLWGLVGTLVLTTMASASQGLRLTRMNIPFMLGTMFTPDRDRAKIYGFMVHLFNGWIFSFFYVAIFHSLHRATWWLGAMAVVWLIFMAILFVVEPFILRESFPRRVFANSDAAFRLVQRAHWVLLGAGLVAAAGGIGGVHG